MADTDVLFEVRTPLRFSVRVTRGRWELIATSKHPVMAGREASVRVALESPDEIAVGYAPLPGTRAIRLS